MSVMYFYFLLGRPAVPSVATSGGGKERPDPPSRSCPPREVLVSANVHRSGYPAPVGGGSDSQHLCDLFLPHESRGIVPALDPYRCQPSLLLSVLDRTAAPCPVRSAPDLLYLPHSQSDAKPSVSCGCMETSPDQTHSRVWAILIPAQLSRRGPVSAHTTTAQGFAWYLSSSVAFQA